MRLSAVVLARFLAYIETYDLNPRGRAHFPAMIGALVERYGFAKFPEKAEDFDEQKGVTLLEGRAGEVAIRQVTIYNQAIHVDCSTSTRDAEKIFHESLSWLSHDFGLIYSPQMVKRKTYISQLTFFSDILLDQFHPALSRVAEKLTKRVPENFGFPLKYQPASVVAIYDPLTIKAGPSHFSVERRTDSPFGENKYFSGAPLPTEEHIELLESFESDVVAFAKR